MIAFLFLSLIRLFLCPLLNMTYEWHAISSNNIEEQHRQQPAMERTNLITSATVIDSFETAIRIVASTAKSEKNNNNNNRIYSIFLLDECVNPIALQNKRSPEKKTNAP